jgi:hypothetical protein
VILLIAFMTFFSFILYLPDCFKFSFTSIYFNECFKEIPLLHCAIYQVFIQVLQNQVFLKPCFINKNQSLINEKCIFVKTGC